MSGTKGMGCVQTISCFSKNPDILIGSAYQGFKTQEDYMTFLCIYLYSTSLLTLFLIAITIYNRFVLSVVSTTPN